MRKLTDNELGKFAFQMPPTEMLRQEMQASIDSLLPSNVQGYKIEPFMLMAIRPHSKTEVMIIIFGKDTHYFAHKLSAGVVGFVLPKGLKPVQDELFFDSYVFNSCASILGCDIEAYQRLRNNMQLIRRYIATKHALRLSEEGIEESKRLFSGRGLSKILTIENARLKETKQLVLAHKRKCVELFGQDIRMNTNCTNVKRGKSDRITAELISAAKKSMFGSTDSVITYLSQCSPYVRDYSDFLQITSI